MFEKGWISCIWIDQTNRHRNAQAQLPRCRVIYRLFSPTHPLCSASSAAARSSARAAAAQPWPSSTTSPASDATPANACSRGSRSTPWMGRWALYRGSIRISDVAAPCLSCSTYKIFLWNFAVAEFDQRNGWELWKEASAVHQTIL